MTLRNEKSVAYFFKIRCCIIYHNSGVDATMRLIVQRHAWDGAWLDWERVHENIGSIYWHDLLHICMFNSYFDTYALNACWNSLWDAHSPKHILQRALRCAQAAVHAGERQVPKIGPS